MFLPYCTPLYLTSLFTSRTPHISDSIENLGHLTNITRKPKNDENTRQTFIMPRCKIYCNKFCTLSSENQYIE